MKRYLSYIFILIAVAGVIRYFLSDDLHSRKWYKITGEFSQNEKPERYYQEKWRRKMGGKSEYALDDLTRVDCLTEIYAVEFDFAPKWKEAVGQSLHYAAVTNKKPYIMLIMQKESDKRYLKQLKSVVSKYNLLITIKDISDS